MGIYEASLPDDFNISAHPNPFNSAVTISAPAGAEIEIYDINGRMVADLSPRNCIRNSDPLIKVVSDADDSVGVGFPDPLSRGRGDRAPTVNSVIWRPDESLGSGVYLVRARIGDRNVTKHIIYLK